MLRLNPTASNLELEVQRFRYKIEAGADFAITQPIYDIEAYEKFFDLLGGVKIPIIMGIWPIMSLRNAEFLKNEVPGVSVPDWVVAAMEKAGDSKEDAVKRGLEIAVNTMEKAKKTRCRFSSECSFQPRRYRARGHSCQPLIELKTLIKQRILVLDGRHGHHASTT